MAHLAQLNVGRTHEPLDHPDIAEFVRALGPINDLAEISPGFVWRLVDESGASSSYVDVPGIDDPNLIVNYSVWEDLESFRHYVYRSGHAAYFRRRREWFEPAGEPHFVCWWTPAGMIDSVGEAYQRLLHLRANGPSEQGWLFNDPWPEPEVA